VALKAKGISLSSLFTFQLTVLEGIEETPLLQRASHTVCV